MNDHLPTALAGIPTAATTGSTASTASTASPTPFALRAPSPAARLRLAAAAAGVTALWAIVLIASQRITISHGIGRGGTLGIIRLRPAIEAKDKLRAALRDAQGHLQFVTDKRVPVVPGSASIVEFLTQGDSRDAA